MLVFLPFALLPVMTNLVTLCESTGAPSKDVHIKSPVLLSTNPTTTAFDSSKSSTRPELHMTSNAPILVYNEIPRYRVLRQPAKLTRLAKSLALGFDPTFSMDYFQPFERRPRPVKLVDFRKNGAVPRYIIGHNVEHRPEIAILQSPYNEVGNFWEEDPRRS